MSITTRKQTPITPSVQDAILVAQIAVGWAGEDGGEDLFKRLLPATWTWAVLQGVREAAARLDAELRSRSHDPDELITLFRFGCFIDERLCVANTAGRPRVNPAGRSTRSNSDASNGEPNGIPAKSHSLSSCPCTQTSNDAGPITFHSRSLTTPSSTLLPPSAI